MAELKYVTIPVGDIASVRDWYVAILGLRIVHETQGLIAILAGEKGCQLGLEMGAPVSEPAQIDLLFQVRDVDEAYKDLLAKGVRVHRGPTDESYGHRNVILIDPVGHKVELFTPISQS